LAVAFAQVDARTLLIDADLRTPRQHVLFGLDNARGLSTQLSGRASNVALTPFPTLNNLDVLPSGPTPPNPLELFSRPGLANVFDQLSAGYDIVLVDTPAFSDGADANMIAAAIGRAVLLARNNHSRVSLFESMIDRLARSNVNMIGSVINDFAATA
jgi:receptor protein-tyrosine kinase